MSTWRRMFQRRPYALVSAGLLVAVLSGDRAQLAPPPGIGIDPFEVLDQQVRNNVLIVLDTSGSMKWPSDRDNFTLGSDDPGSRMFQAKAAIKAVVAANQNRVNFGLVSYNALSSDKNLNENQDFEADGRTDGPFIYVSADGTAAANFYVPYSNANDGSTAENELCSNVDGFFCAISNTFAAYDGANSGDVWRSFMNRGGTNQVNAYNNAYPTGCQNPAGVLSPMDAANGGTMRCRYYMQSRLLRNNVRFTWDRASTNVTTRLVGTAPIICPAPPAGLLGHTFTPPCFQIQDGVGGPVATFYYSSAIYQQQTGTSCGGGALIAPVARCDANNAATVLANMDPELPVTPAGTLNGVPTAPGNASFDYGDGHLDGDQTLPFFGLRADQSTPLAGTLNFIRTTAAPAYPAGPVVPTQRNFVILVTDGDDTCADPSDLNHSAAMAADQAELLYNNFNPATGIGNFTHWGETMVVGFANAVANPAAVARLNVISQAGSGRNITNGAASPAAAMTGSTCPAGAACRDAFFANNTQQLVDILNAALEQASSTGFFSATPAVFDGVPEYANTVPPSPFPSPFSVLNPEVRYTANAFRTYRASFEAGTFKGFVKGFDPFGAMTGPAQRPAPVGSPSPLPPLYPRNWEAGQRLIDTDRVSSDLDPATGTDHTFAQLLVSSSTPLPPGDLPGNPHIHRRIFTTRQNGRRLARIDPNPTADDLAGTSVCAPGPCRVNLWPPDMGSVVQPAADYATPGILDTRLFRMADGTQMTITDLQAAPLRACMGTNLPAQCTSGTASVKLAAAQKEAREMIIAFTAGAEPRRTGSDPVRDATSKQIVYRRRAWLLAESTLGTPALVTQPSSITPTIHTQEYLLYRDGPRDQPSGQASGGNSDSFLRLGFGLRNPDRDGKETPVGSQTRNNLKPSISMVIVPSNDMLHAFRAGPCPTGVATCTGESGGEELWAFVPHDLLPSLKGKMTAQSRTAHTFMIATSLRTADVFVPGASTLSVSGKTYALSGRWRRLLLFGRGLGGKYYTALDITGMGSLTSPALGTQLPAVLWNRGNPDTNDGLLGTAPLNGTAAEYTSYLDMGTTWSTPAVARVNPATNANREFVAYVGSGYSTTDPREGTRFYTLDPTNGDIVASADVGEGLQPAFQNALVANPVIFSGQRLLAGIDLPHPATPVNESVFIGDIHGRLWKFDSNAPGTALLFRNLGPDQPLGVGAALLNLGAPHVFVETGYDARVPAPPNGFRMFGFKDSGPPYPTSVINPPLPAPEFGLSFPAPPPGKGDYRGTLQPLTAFQGSSSAATGVVFFVGTRFNPPDATCLSSFDTIVFGLVAKTGGVSYATTEYTGSKAVGLTRPPLPPPPGPSTPPPFDEGTGQGGNPPRTDGPPANLPGGKAIVKTVKIRPGSTVCR